MLTLTLTRTELALADLVIDSDPFTGSFHLPEDGIEWPRFDTRRIYAPDSGIVEGRTLLSAIRDLGTLTATIYAHGDTTADVKVAQNELEAATSQFAYTLTLTVDGVVWGSWTAQPERPAWGAIDTGMVRARIARATVVFPIEPGA